MERTKTWFVAMCLMVIGIVLLVNGWFFTGILLLLLGCAAKLID